MIAWALIIFLPAWTINYLRGWIYFFVFIIPCILITVYFFKHDKRLIEHRLTSGPTAEKERNQKIIQSFTGLLCIVLNVLSVFDFRFGWSEVSFYISLISDFFILVGFYIMFLVFKENSFASSVIEVQEEQKVISTGLYSKVRHPMYSGGILMFIFIPPALGSLYGLICSMFLIIFIYLRAIDEEKLLLRNLNGYKEYCDKVRYRLIPFIW